MDKEIVIGDVKMTTKVCHATERTYQTATNMAAVAMAMALLEHVETSIDVTDAKTQLVITKIRETRQSIHVTDNVGLYDHVHTVTHELAFALNICGHTAQGNNDKTSSYVPQRDDTSPSNSSTTSSTHSPSSSEAKSSSTVPTPSCLSDTKTLSTVSPSSTPLLLSSSSSQTRSSSPSKPPLPLSTPSAISLLPTTTATNNVSQPPSPDTSMVPSKSTGVSALHSPSTKSSKTVTAASTKIVYTLPHCKIQSNQDGHATKSSAVCSVL